VQLADKLKIIKTDNFDPDAYVQSKCRAMDEKVRNPSALGFCLQC
jgi:exocyst complex component 8